MKRFQNKVAESGLSLPVTAIGALCVWMVATSMFSGGLSAEGIGSLACFVLAVYLMVEMSNGNALLRIRSRMVSVCFMSLMCTMSPLFGSFTGALTQGFVIFSTLLLLSTYQDKGSPGRVFYAFVFVGLASLTFVQTLLLLPLLWLLMATQLQSLTWRSLFASLLGTALPYWLVSPWFIYQRDASLLAGHFASLATVRPPFQFGTVAPSLWVAYALVVVLTAIGIFSFWHHSYEDKIRIRLLYGYFTWMAVVCLVLVVLQPCHFDPLMRLAVVFASPLIAHFMALTNSRLTNIMFIAIMVLTLIVTILNLFQR
ncbi:MAG: hypothetical protein II826_06695 [Prevotella sp.]|nr:hypothetical protein [Prevotella sp.]